MLVVCVADYACVLIVGFSCRVVFCLCLWAVVYLVLLFVVLWVVFLFVVFCSCLWVVYSGFDLGICVVADVACCVGVLATFMRDVCYFAIWIDVLFCVNITFVFNSLLFRFDVWNCCFCLCI